jgi:phenylacetate-CoA ligase
VGYTKDDLAVWTSAMVRTLAACGLGQGDIVQNAYGYGLFTGGLGFHYGAEALGATVIPVSGGNTDRQIMLMKDCRVTAFCSTPSYFVHIIERATELGLDVSRLHLRMGVLGAEPWTESMRRHIETSAGVKAYDMYGLAEIAGPGVASECTSQSGLHILEDHFYPEIIDPATGQTLPEGEEGELVLTTLSKWAMPVLRYRTRDITAFIPGTCPCGRTNRRMRRIKSRSDDMFIIRGVNVFPSQVEAALMAVEGTLPHYQIILTRKKGLDEMEVQVEVTPEIFSDRIRALDNLHTRLLDALERSLGIRVQVRFVEPHNIQRSEGKAKRLIDQRNLEEK